MGLALAVRKPKLIDTFILPRRQVLWPQLATSSVGTWGWTASTSSVFGGWWGNSSASLNDRLNFENVTLLSGPATLKVLYVSESSGGLISVYWGDDKIGEFDSRGGGVTYNAIQTVSLGTVSNGRKQLSLRVEGTNGSGYRLRVQQIEIVQPTGSNLGTSTDSLPWFGDIPPYMYSAASGTPSLVQTTSVPWGSYLDITTVQNGWAEYDVWLAQGTYTLYANTVTRGNGGIATVSIDGVDVGTYDTWSSSVTYTAQKTITSITVPTTGVHTVRLTAATQNPSSSGYYLSTAWLHFRKTASTGAITPTGTTYGVGSMELWPWFADVQSGFNTFTLDIARLHYATFYNNPDAINQYQEWEHSLSPGTYGLTTIGRRAATAGRAHWSENGGEDLAIIDQGVGSLTDNFKWTASLALSGGTLKQSVDSKSGSNYFLSDTVHRLVRTGD